jgi:drug/metabolite transporter (DMT)-like permease
MSLSAAAQANLLGLGAAATWGVSDFCGGLATKRAFPALVVGLSHSLSLLTVLAFLALSGTPFPSASTLQYGLLSGVAGGIGLMLFYAALAIGPMGLNSALTGVITAILPVIYSYIHSAHPSPAQWAGFALAILAIWMIAYTPGGKLHPRGLGLAVGAGIGFGLLLIFLEKAGSQSVGWALASSRMASAAIAGTLAILTLVRRRGRVFSPFAVQESALPRRRWLLFLPLVVTASLLEVSGNFFYTVASVLGRLDVAAVLSSLYPGFTILLAAWLLRERTTRAQALGMGLALGAVVLISL